MKWWVYIVECRDGSYYTGITTCVESRVRRHNEGKGAKYTRGRYPVTLLAAVQFRDRSEASRVEYAVKKVQKRKKIDFLLQNSGGSSIKRVI